MKAVPECIPCSLKQLTSAKKHIPGFTAAMEEQALREAMRGLAGRDNWFSVSPAAITETCLHAMAHAMGTDDPFREPKRHFNEVAAELIDEARAIIRSSHDRLATALLTAAAGNIIDLGVVAHVDVSGTLRRTLDSGFAIDHVERFRRRLNAPLRAGGRCSLLYIGDNAGEIMFDALTVELLAEAADVTFVVRGGPILNDALEEDAALAGIPRHARLMTTGCNRLGILEGCSDEFWQAFHGADLVIAKGHANYETIEQVRPGVFFLLTAKCEPVANRLGVKVGDTVFMEGQ